MANRNLPSSTVNRTPFMRAGLSLPLGIHTGRDNHQALEKLEQKESEKSFLSSVFQSPLRIRHRTCPYGATPLRYASAIQPAACSTWQKFFSSSRHNLFLQAIHCSAYQRKKRYGSSISIGLSRYRPVSHLPFHGGLQGSIRMFESHTVPILEYQIWKRVWDS